MTQTSLYLHPAVKLHLVHIAIKMRCSQKKVALLLFKKFASKIDQAYFAGSISMTYQASGPNFKKTNFNFNDEELDFLINLKNLTRFSLSLILYWVLQNMKNFPGVTTLKNRFQIVSGINWIYNINNKLVKIQLRFPESRCLSGFTPLRACD